MDRRRRHTGAVWRRSHVLAAPEAALRCGVVGGRVHGSPTGGPADLLAGRLWQVLADGLAAAGKDVHRTNKKC